MVVEFEFNKLIIDANVVFSALIKREWSFELIIMILPKKGIAIYSPEFLWEEVRKREGRILEFSGLDPERLRFFISLLSKKIKIVPKSEHEKFIPKAKKILSSHPKDIPYAALAISFKEKGEKFAFWCNEARLNKILPGYGIKVLTTHELLDKLGLVV